MNLRQICENNELKTLSKFATKSKDSKGRVFKENKCDCRTDFQRDRDRILHSKSFRRLMHKTQVFLSPEGDHYRTRLTHTLEVSQISRTIARALGLNEDLTEAIALGHDLGHTPFGHTGEKVLDKLMPLGFCHNKQSLRVVELLETKSNLYKGLNLTFEVKDGILNHTGDKLPCTMEGEIVRYSDRIAYINHDIDDAIRAGIINVEQIPVEYKEILGYSHGERINNMINDIIDKSIDKTHINMNDKIKDATLKLRQFLFENVYYNSTAKSEDEKASFLIESLYNYYLVNYKRIPKFYYNLIEYCGCSVEEVVKDYISGMTDRFAIKVFKELYLPNPWEK